MMAPPRFGVRILSDVLPFELREGEIFGFLGPNGAAKTGAGNVMVRNGLGKVTVDPRFSKINGNTYRSPDHVGAADKVEFTLNSGAGNVSVTTKQDSDRRLSGM